MSDPVLVLGGSGLVGAQLLPQLAQAGIRVEACTRAAAPPAGLAETARWHCGAGFDLHAGAGPWPTAATLLSAGPLTSLADWLSRTRPVTLRRLVALGSTSERGKRSSPDARERALAASLRAAEDQVIAWCDRHAVAWTLLRPTLIWGQGRDHNLSRLAALARRRRLLPLPAFATGLRQPIRSRDVAGAMVAAIRRPASAGHILDLPGGETLAYDEMVRRIVAAVAPSTRVLSVPTWIARPALSLARVSGLVTPSFQAMALRMREDLVYDDRPARELLAIWPEGFKPCDEDFPST